jgi:hypothetical protein
MLLGNTDAGVGMAAGPTHVTLVSAGVPTAEPTAEPTPRDSTGVVRGVAWRARTRNAACVACSASRLPTRVGVRARGSIGA